MAKADFGEYSAYTTPGGIRFMKAGRLTSENGMPPEVVSYLKDKLGDDSGKVKPTFPVPSEEEKARMRAESLQVPAELQMTPEEVVARTPVEAPVESSDAPQLTPEDFDVEPVVETKPQENVMNVIEPEVDPNFLESVSIYTASLEDIAQALYDRFGIYTVYLRKLPANDEINPLTGQAFTKYHLGIAYQAAIFAQNQGILDREPDMRRQMDTNREASQNFQVDPVAYTMAEARQADSFAYRTSVRGTQSVATTRIEHVRGEDGQLHAVQVPIPPDELGNENLNGAGQKYNPEQEEMIVEPPITGGRPIVRPNW